MRTASTVLSIIGGTLAIIIAVFLFFGGVMLKTVAPTIKNLDLEGVEYCAYNDSVRSMYFDEETTKEFFENVTDRVGFLSIIAGWALFVSATLGIVGGILAKKKNVLAGILMIVGALLSIFTLVGILPGLLLIAGGILAIIKDPKKPAPPVEPVVV